MQTVNSAQALSLPSFTGILFVLFFLCFFFFKGKIMAIKANLEGIKSDVKLRSRSLKTGLIGSAV